MRTQRGTAWRGAIVAGVAVLTVLLAPARAEASDESRLLFLTNQVRASRGLPVLTIDSQLGAVAQQWAATLAQRGVLSHNASLPSQVSGWKLLGENVGVGGTVDAVHEGWMGSPTHLENLVDPAFTKVGFGIVRPDARIFVVQIFMLPKTATTSPVPVQSRLPVVKPAAPSPAPAQVVAQAPSASPAGGELSPWMVHSLDRLRSMEPVKVG